jgi:hypothetical protein
MATSVGNTPAEFDVLEWVSRTSLEYIGQGGIGYNFGAFAEADPSGIEYMHAVRQIL